MSDFLASSKQSKITFKEFIKQELLRNKKFKVKNNKSVMLFPNAVEMEYIKFVKGIMRRFTTITVNAIQPYLKESINETTKQLDSSYHVDSILDVLKDLLGLLKKQTAVIFEGAKSEDFKTELTFTAKSVDEKNQSQFSKIIKNKLGFNYIPQKKSESMLIKAWVENNVNLIKGLSDEYIKNINQTVLQSFQQGETADFLVKKLQKINNTFSKSRAELIAVDQIGKLNGALTQQRQLEVGVDKYYWRTVRDERVRESHRVMDGKLCRWDDPTVYSNDGGKTWIQRNGVMLHPSFDFRCRCYSDPYWDDILNEAKEEL